MPGDEQLQISPPPNQVYSGSKTLHISLCQIYNYVVVVVSINLDYYYI